MRIVFLTQYYPPEIGAPQRRLSGLARRLVQRGHDVTVLTAMPNYPKGVIHPGYGGFVRTEERDGAKVIHAFIYPTQKADYIRRLANYFSFVLSSAVAGSALLKRSEYLLVESPPLFLGLAAFWLSRLKRSRLIFNVSDLWPESPVRLGMLRRGSAVHRVSEWLEGFCYRRSWLVTGQARTILEDIVRRFPRAATYHLSNGVDTAQYRAERRTEEARARLATNGDCLALYAGLHGLAQGLDQVLGAAHQIAEEGGCRFVFIGEGPEKQALKDKAEELRLTNTLFLDSLPSAEMPPLVASADIILVTLKLFIPGAVPSKLYEAMAAGRPVVLVADGEAAEIVRDNNAGIVVRPGDINGLAQAIRRLRDQPALRRELGENGRKAAEDRFDSTKIADRFIDHLEASRPS
jgi:glycosyltransferase involved in cell wall biosynthesis